MSHRTDGSQARHHGRSRRPNDDDESEKLLSHRLGRKIRSQATQLADLTERLRQQEAYSRIVEKRLLQVEPGHPLPVTPFLVHRLRSASSPRPQRSLTAGKGQSRDSKIGREGDGGTHAQERTKAEGDENDLSIRRRGNEVAQGQLKDAAQLIRQLRDALKIR